MKRLIVFGFIGLLSVSGMAQTAEKIGIYTNGAGRVLWVGGSDGLREGYNNLVDDVATNAADIVSLEVDIVSLEAAIDDIEVGEASGAV